MERFSFVSNFGRTRRASLNGRDYIVAPLTLIVPGVLNGSQGPLYYPPDEIKKSASAWNGIPLVVYHPTHMGVPVSGRDPEILEKSGIGYVYKAHITDNGTLKAEGWFDIEHTRRVDPRVLNALESNSPIELSTGLFTDNYPSAPNSVHRTNNGDREYQFIARNYRPDHLAILPDQVGACSVKDGCGVLVNQEQAQSLFSRFWEWMTSQPNYSVTPVTKPGGGETTENKDWSQEMRDKLPDDDFAGPHESYPIKTQADLDNVAHLIGHAEDPEAVKAKAITIAKRKGLTLPDSWKSGEEDTTTNTSTEDEEVTLTINLDLDLLTNTELGVNKEFTSDDERRAAFAAMADAGGGNYVSTKEMKAQGGGKETHTGRGGAEKGSGRTTETHSGKGGTETSTGRAGPTARSGASGALHKAAQEASANAVQRSKLAKKAGSSVPGRAEKEHRKAWAAHLEAQTAHEAAGNHELAAHHEKAAGEHLSRARHFAGTSNRSHTLNAKTRNTIVEELVANGCACGGDKDTLLTLSDRTLMGMVKRMTTNKPMSPDEMMTDHGEMDSEAEEPDVTEPDSDDDVTTEGRTGGDSSTPQQKKPPYQGGTQNRGRNTQMTANQWLASAPPAIQGAVRNAMAIERAERERIVGILTQNHRGEQQKRLQNYLMGKSLEELKTMLLLAPPTNNFSGDGQEEYGPYGRLGSPPPRFDLAGVSSPTTNRAQDDDSDDILMLPTINYQEIVEEQRAQSR